MALRMLRARNGALVMLGCALAAGMAWAAAAEEPPLPSGLDDAAPALPPGLGGPSDDAPSIPPGLDGGGGEAPSLPPGLGDGPSGGAPALPPGLDAQPGAPAPEAEDASAPRMPLDLHGFWEVRGGLRIQDDPAQSKDATIGETRLQLELDESWRDVVFEFTGDVIGDAVLEEADFDLRRLRLSWRPLNWLDVRAGRQVLTWGTGDLIFINDLFPKDWQAFFSGRDQEYLKAPSSTLRVGVFHDIANLEVAYTPQFEPDRFITGERFSYYSPIVGRAVGRDREADYNAPSSWFQDDEVAWRIYRNVGSVEAAVYGYSGYWKSPGGQRFFPMQATFPKLSVYGASLRGTVGKGIGNVEVGYYDSRQDRDGGRPLVNNSEFRLLLGYEQELAKEFTGAVQYYVEHMMDYDAYRNTLPRILEPRDENRHVLTLRLTKLLMNQNLTLSLFTYWSPSDEDAYLRPRVTYKVSDQWTVEAGGNAWIGADDYTFFGQFEDNTNVYAGLRYAF